MFVKSPSVVKSFRNSFAYLVDHLCNSKVPLRLFLFWIRRMVIYIKNSKMKYWSHLHIWLSLIYNHLKKGEQIQAPQRFLFRCYRQPTHLRVLCAIRFRILLLISTRIYVFNNHRGCTHICVGTKWSNAPICSSDSPHRGSVEQNSPSQCHGVRL